MIKRNLASLAALGVFSVFAAGSTPDIINKVKEAAGAASGGGGGNQAACLEYVEHYNSLACIKKVGATFTPSDMCPPELDITPQDMTGYYNCLKENSKCNGDIPDLAGASSCRP